MASFSILVVPTNRDFIPDPDAVKAAAELLKAEGFAFDLAYTSVLKRAIRTLWIALDEMLFVSVVSATTSLPSAFATM